MGKLIQGHKIFTPFFIITLMVLFASCEKDDRYNYQVLSGDEATEDIDVLIVSGNYQECAVNDTTADSMIVYVSKNLVAQVAWPVYYSIIAGEGYLLTSQNLTDINGHAGTKFIPSGLPGTIKIQVLPYNGDSAAVFTITSTD